MNKDYFVPRLSGFLDLGSQAENFAVNKEAAYYMAGLQLDIPIFSGNRNRDKIKQARLDIQEAELKLESAKQQIALSGKVSKNNLRSAYELYQSSLIQLEAAETYQRLIERGYKAGTNSYIETIDARNQLTSARIDANIRQYQVL